MTIKYKVVSTFKPGTGKKGEQICFPRLTGSTTVGLEGVSGILAHRSSAGKGDIYLVLTEFAELIPELLADGKTVKIDHLGSFSLHARVSTGSLPEEVSSGNIKEVRLSFRADNRVKQKLKRVKFKKQE